MYTPEQLFENLKTIAVVGLSPDPNKSSNSVAKRLQRLGLTIIPVNPTITKWDGLSVYPSVSAIPSDIEIDIVDVFRREEFLVDAVKDALARKPLPKCVWLQSGLSSNECKRLCDEAGVLYIEDSCLGVEFGFYHSQKKTTLS